MKNFFAFVGIILVLGSCVFEQDLSSKIRYLGYVLVDSTESEIVPNQVMVNEKFTVVIHTQGPSGSSCSEVADVVQTREGNIITLVPYAWEVIPPSGICTTDIARLRHEVKLGFDSQGEYVIQIPYENEGNTGVIEKRVNVR